MNILNYTIKELEEYLTNHGFKKYNARQIYEWVYKKKQNDISNMSNLSNKLKEFLSENMSLPELKIVSHQISRDGTQKFLFELEDKNVIETVLMKHDYGNSVCVTTQLGCNIGCSFCASGLHKKKRDLLASEIVLQVLKVEEIVKERISHVVVMGIGEPFDNYDNTMKFLHIINSPYGLEIGARHITVSTSGIVDKIRKFADEKLQVNLAISLHASNNIDRSVLMKINNRYKIEDVIETSKYYIEKTNRRITFEYILLDGLNDTLDKANQLSDLLRGMNCYVNLIRYNSVQEFEFVGSSEKQALAFKAQLLKRGINVTLRKEKGAEIDAACGQLRSKSIGGIK
jgi:23S rRNA (adenine2503-C2)-methyltransferase